MTNPQDPDKQAPQAYPPPTELPAAPPPPPSLYVYQDSQLMLPEGTELATHGRRIGAFFLGILLWVVTLGIGYIIWGLIVWGRGQTPALQVLGCRVYRPGARKVASWGFMALREIVGRIAEGILGGISLLVSFVLFLVTKERRAIHDYVASTVVLYDPNKVLDRQPGF